GDQVIGEFVEVADPADHRGRRNDLVDVCRQLGHQGDVLRVALDEPVARVDVVGLGQPAVLAEVVEPDHLVARIEQLGDEIAVDEPRGAGDEDLHRRMPDPRAPQMSTTSLPPTWRPRYALWGTPSTRTSLSWSTQSRVVRRSSWTYGSVHTTRAPAHARSLRS